MKLLNPIIDKLQATFPPNRICILLAGPIVAFSAWLSALIATNVPGVELSSGIVAGIIGAAVLIVITLLYKWFDQWQAGEPIAVDADLNDAFEEIVSSHAQVDQLLGGAAGIEQALLALRLRVAEDDINPVELATELEAIGIGISQVLEGTPPEVAVASSSATAVAAPPTAASVAAPPTDVE